ncbi:type I-E CRISPR-associated protein Cse1/CasA [Thiorhodovibrio frisius]|uniref:CRISPR type I-E-associated protein CasA/Cse1 n=1 Tax=Thiorhodovibrio frisius TaxID=631362 RepID=H8Z8N0_9GAMM|nr:type I-E CRISPR-associated protein Cse1/CasA [Thiorhodovibrio frisius]EIC19435.1 CRISPR type I-E-associated protein CasA/Cse1 [Thiorhodovibrio frisius]WPL22262.1 CRISPR-associated protein CasA/Cse1 [Thiorhodovibrio frisius]
MLNLALDEWIPARRAANNVCTELAPWQITMDIDDDPFVTLDAPRADFNAALMQFLIGLLQTTFAPRDADQWFERMELPPTPEELQAAFRPFAHAFELGGQDARFMQDQDALADREPLPISALLIDMAGSETHFVKGLAHQGFSPAMAAMALYTLQTNAPSGGVGHRTSVRGGGPLTTLVLATRDNDDRQPTLWQTLWLNVLDEETLGYSATPADAERIFPWLVATRTSEKGGRDTSPEKAHPLQVFWGMPRRIRLDLENIGESSAECVCALSGQPSANIVSAYRTKNYGTNYIGAWQHPLSPYSYDGKELLCMHPRGSINYRHWLGLVQSSKDSKTERLPALVVQRFTDGAYRLEREGWRFRLWACGYDMDNMKPRCWFESTLPLFPIQDRNTREMVESAAERMIEAAGHFLGNLRGAIKDAWFAANDPRRKSARLDHVSDAFWQETESAFYDGLGAVAGAADTQAKRFEQFQNWHRYLQVYTQNAFDLWVDYNQITDQSHPRRIAEARRNLRRFNYKKKIKDLLEISDKRGSAQQEAA